MLAATDTEEIVRTICFVAFLIFLVAMYWIHTRY